MKTYNHSHYENTQELKKQSKRLRELHMNRVFVKFTHKSDEPLKEVESYIYADNEQQLVQGVLSC